MFTLIELNDDLHLNLSLNDIYEYCAIPPRTARRIRASESTRRLENREDASDHRGERSTAIDPDKLYEMQLTIDQGEFNDRAQSWKQLGATVGLTGRNRVHWQTIKSAMEELRYHKRKARHARFLKVEIRQVRIEFALDHRHWTIEWKRVYFSDEVHFGQGARRTRNVIRRPEEVNDEACIQYDREPANPEHPQKRFHCWLW